MENKEEINNINNISESNSLAVKDILTMFSGPIGIIIGLQIASLITTSIILAVILW